MRYLGLITGLSNKEILILSSLIIRTFLIIYTSLIYESSIIPYLILILFADVVYMICKPSKILFELVNITAQIVLIYFTNVLKTYRMQEGNGQYIEQIIIILIGIVIIYSMYFFLKNFEDLISKKGEKRNEKECKEN